MAEQPENKKWDFAEKHLVKKDQPLPQKGSDPVLAPIVDEGIPQPKGMIESWKTNKIERNQRIEILTERTKGQLEAWRHYVEGQVVIAKQRIDAHVEAQLMEITRQHLINLREIGIGNLEDRQRALEELTSRAAEQLRRADGLDVPPTMKQKLIDAAINGFEQLFDKIASEEIRPPKAKKD